MTPFSSIEIDPGTVAELRRGLRGAQEAVYRAFERPVFGLCVRILQDDAQAADASQDTFIQVLGGAAKLKQGDALAGWIRSIAVNECLQRLRSPWHKRRQALPESDALDPTVACHGAAASDAEKAFARLDGDARMVVWLHEVEGYTHGEIASLFDKTTSFSKSQLARALAELRQRLAPGDAVAARSTPSVATCEGGAGE
ncbi:MAG: sigma-70 family RNA polymerase sigma factor [Pseudomonadaceae bacterium]|nr:sigma-70 family RNA polymerase sigma factor [Pseudomonadaceae bacterium]